MEFIDRDHPITKTFRDGTHRLISPNETVTKIHPFMRPMGITRVANVTGLDCIGIPVVMVYRPNARSLAVSQGKGLDLAAAKASGLMEAVELYHAEHITLPLKLASYEEMKRDHCVVEVMALASVANSRFHFHLPILWIEGYDLLHHESVWLPYETVSVNATYPEPTGSGCFAASSNGLSSGNHLLEAITYGICEVVERDATTLWHLSGEAAHQKTRLDPATVDDPDCRYLLGLCDLAGITTILWDMTMDIGIPTFQCLLIERTDDPMRLLYSSAGMGSHPVRQVALLRAITEAAQSRLTLIAGSRDDVFRNEYEHRVRSLEYLRNQLSLLKTNPPQRHFHEAPSLCSETFDEDVLWELENLCSAGIRQVIVVNLTKPEYQLPVVRVVIPGLEGSDKLPVYAPGARAKSFMDNLA